MLVQGAALPARRVAGVTALKKNLENEIEAELGETRLVGAGRARRRSPQSAAKRG